MRASLIALTAGVVGLGFGTAIPRADAQAAPPGQKPGTVADFPDLRKGLIETPGCLGVEGVAAKGGKQMVLFAWFKNKKSVESWYYSKMHQDAMKRFFPGTGGRKPLSEFKDENAPVLMIAAVTPGATTAPGTNLAVSQISIEAYTPVPGGVAYGGTFAPEGLKVPSMIHMDR